MISKVSCDTDDWSNDAENSALHHRNKLQQLFLNSNNIPQITFFTVFIIKEMQPW